ncbi:small proline-rich protein 3 isoform X2 [Pongo abelii]|uniref:small proline-rich protein 3 isoform X2 n=1 Tax=Pongo abelii TaxID=9601 RepID=UPI0004F423F7|nr:small proline-rich protein 3 isoform X2 [Pongo abelii]
MSSYQQKQTFTPPPQLQQQQVKQPSQPPPQETFVPITKEPCHSKVPQPGNTKIPEPGCTKFPEPGCYTKVPEPHPSMITPGPAQQKTKQK